MNSRSNSTRARSQRSTTDFGTTRRAVLAAGGAVALSGLAGCSAIDGLLDRAGEQVLGTIVSSPAAFYAGRAPRDQDADGDELQFSIVGDTEVREVPATVRADSREIELEGWSTSAATKSQDYNASRSNKPSTEWRGGHDDNGDDNDVDEDAIIEYLDDEPTIGERFTVSLPNAKLPGDPPDRLPSEIKPGRVLAYFAPSREPDSVRAPFSAQYGSQGISCDDEGCIQLDGPVSLHEDISCQNIISAELDTYRTANRGIVGYSTEGGAVVSAAPESADIDGKCVFVAGDGMLREPESLDSWGPDRTAGDASVSASLVCPVTVTPADCPCPLPGLFYVRRVIHDNQVIFAGGWILDEGALFEDSVTLLFDEGPTDVASVTPEDIESDDYEDRILSQFSRDRSRRGSAVVSGEFDADGDGIPAALKASGGRKGLNAVNVKVVGERGGDDETDLLSIFMAETTMDAPLVHLAGASELSSNAKAEAVRGIDKKQIRRGM